MQGLHKHVGWAVLVSELSHVFCCVIPTIVTILSAFANLGLFVVSPTGTLMNIHNMMHSYEMPVIVFSGAMVAIGWVAHMLSREVDCHNTGCGHPPCSPQKTKNSKVLVIATLLFVLNLGIYLGIHRNVLDLEMFHTHAAHERHEDEHDGHHHDEIAPKSL